MTSVDRPEPIRRPPSRRGLGWFAVAAIVGAIHAGFSAYWALGGTWLLETVGRAVLEAFRGSLWIIGLVALAKLAAALVPLIVERLRAVVPRWLRAAVRAVSWLGAIGLILKGGIVIIMAQLALAGILDPGPDPDIPSLNGHAWIWDPLFALWGLALLIGLLRSRPGVIQAASGRRA